MNLYKVFWGTIKNSIKDFWTNKKGFFLIGIFLLILFINLIFIIFYSFLHYLIVYIPGGYIFAPKMLGVINMIIFIFIAFLSFIATVPTMFKNKELPTLLTLPISLQTILNYNLIKLIYFALYGSILILLPIYIAYGIANNFNLLYYPFSIILIILFTILSVIIGTISFWMFNLTILSLPKFIKNISLIFLTISILYILYQTFPKLEIKDKTTGFTLMEKYIFTFDISNLIYPYNWFNKLIYYISENNILKSFILLFFIISTIFLLYNIFLIIGKKFYLKGIRNIENFNIFSNKTSKLKNFTLTRYKYINLFIKDFLIHFRDPVQWTQILIFIALTIIYIFIIKGYSIKNIQNPTIVTILTLTGLGLVGFFIGGIALRFVFPNISLEGKSFWVIKLAPINLIYTYFIKFLFFLIFILSISFALIYSYMNIIGILPEIKILIYFITLFIAIFITNIFFTLGAIFPNFKETNPSKISTSYGGLLAIFLANSVILSIIAILWIPLNNFYNNLLLCKNTNYQFLVLLTIGIIIGLIILNIFIFFIGFKKFKELEI